MSNFYLDYPACMNAAGRVASRGTIASGPSTHRYDNIRDSMNSVIIPLFSLLSKFMNVTSAAPNCIRCQGSPCWQPLPSLQYFVLCCSMRVFYMFVKVLVSSIDLIQISLCLLLQILLHFNSIVQIPCSLRISSFGTWGWNIFTELHICICPVANFTY